MGLAALFGGGPQHRAEGITVKGDPRGIQRGWFMHPLNFDPTWLLECSGFEARQTAAATT